ncbi:ankyrin repeat domain-containing protein [Mycobacteroides abscessus]|uniref:ankyrin repeat domain-containing protein n=1 Tax=Mycobacteroides abscessus TaxID=36809 RepID=UPI001055F3F1|nr:ankyrin repeat domain-containing protein [Mycobacteroides abscessus]
MTDLISRPGRVVTVIAVFVGAWVLWIKRDSDTDLFHLISGLAIGGPALVCIWALGVITYRWIVANAGPPSEWNRRRAIQGALILTACMGLAAGMQKLSDWLKNKNYLGHYLDSVDPHNINSMRVFCVLMMAGALVPMSRAARATLFPYLPASEKIGFVSFIFFLFSVQILLGGIAINGYSDTWSHTAGMIAIGVSLIVMFCSWIVSGVEWVGKYKKLRSQRIEIPRKGFSPRLFAFWTISVLILTVGVPLSGKIRSPMLELLLLPLMLFAGFGFYYLLATSYFYVRRVTRIYERSQVRDVLELVAEVSDDGQSYLHLACVAQDVESVRTFLEIGLDPNLQDKWGNTPLIYAMQNRVLDIVNLLIDFGADPYMENYDGDSPYTEAERMRDEDCIAIFANRERDDNADPPPGG